MIILLHTIFNEISLNKHLENKSHIILVFPKHYKNSLCYLLNNSSHDFNYILSVYNSVYIPG